LLTNTSSNANINAPSLSIMDALPILKCTGVQKKKLYKNRSHSHLNSKSIQPNTIIKFAWTTETKFNQLTTYQVQRTVLIAHKWLQIQIILWIIKLTKTKTLHLSVLPCTATHWDARVKYYNDTALNEIFYFGKRLEIFYPDRPQQQTIQHNSIPVSNFLHAL